MRYLPAFALDAVLVLVFAAIGRASHDEDPAGFLVTAWPFLVALVVGHALAALLPGRPRRPWSLAWGAVAWAVTVAGGMLLRVSTGETAQVPFIIVATVVLGVFLVGWRALAAGLRRRRADRAHGITETGEPADGPEARTEAGDARSEAGEARTDAGEARADEPGDAAR
jgi:peptidoglycan/LPS O-acetylase OafA/YrhL